MQNFFAIVKKIFSLSDHPTTLLENLNEGYHPGCHYGTAGRENISRTNQLHDVANHAASFALIPIAITPTAMNQFRKKTSENNYRQIRISRHHDVDVEFVFCKYCDGAAHSKCKW